MTAIFAVNWTLAVLSFAAAAIFFWRRDRIAGLCFVIVFIVLLGGIFEKRLVLTSAMLNITFEQDHGTQEVPVHQ
ncbi:hypothetical protein [Bradyrhizobium sp. AZCC 2230]|uniref:hypothetical protein n=1 Tax=Bradyrhizobium sp. AZCC 2230 TaxID=3117021 RepID=UPI002FF06D5C